MHTDVEKITPYGGEEIKSVQIKHAFNRIAPRYDFMNRLLSMGIDVTWRKRALKSFRSTPVTILDLATGTGDMAIMEAKKFPEAEITGMDLSEEMLTIAEQKSTRNNLSSRIRFVQGDCLASPFADNSFDLATIAFGIRNFEDIAAGCREMLRILRPGGTLVILELSRPQVPLFSSFYHFYLTKVIPAMGKLFAGRPVEYAYLQKSISCVPQGEEVLRLLRSAGFTDCRTARYTFGACSCYTAVKTSIDD